MSIILLLFSLYLLEVDRVVAQTNGDLRLFNNGVTGSNYNEGRLQVYINGQWGNVCDDGFDVVAATTACRQLGYESATAFATQSNDSFGIDGRSALLSLNCNANDLLHIFQCDYSMSVSCNASNEVSIFCSSTRIWDNAFLDQVRLQGGTYPSQGLIEVYTHSWYAVCSDLVDTAEANTVCRQLGYTGASSYNQLNLDSSRSQIGSAGCCIRSESCISDCPCSSNTNRKRFACINANDATVQCEFDTSQASNAGKLDQCNFTKQQTIAAIVGGVIGGIIFVIIAIVFIGLVVCFIRKRFN